jgi:beta-hydroxylase
MNELQRDDNNYNVIVVIIIAIMIMIMMIATIVFIAALDGYMVTEYVSKINKSHINRDTNGRDVETYNTSATAFFQKLRNNWTIIRDEYIDYNSKYKQHVRRSRDLIPMNAVIDTGDTPWENIILRVFDSDTELITHFPKTYNLIRDDCTFAMFSILPPNKKLAPHYGPYNGILRYHLGLIVPKDKDNCFLMINNNKYIWGEGDDILFDDTLLHSVENNTNDTRVVLFLDVHRTFDNPIITILNKTILYFGKFNTTVDIIVDNTNKMNTTSPPPPPPPPTTTTTYELLGSGAKHSLISPRLAT